MQTSLTPHAACHQGAHIPNFGKLCWVAEPTSPNQLRPTFVLLDAYAKSHAVQCGRGALLASTANRGGRP